MMNKIYALTTMGPINVDISTTLIFLENDLEVFIDGRDCDYGLEVNAANTVYEVFFN